MADKFNNLYYRNRGILNWNHNWPLVSPSFSLSRLFRYGRHALRQPACIQPRILPTPAGNFFNRHFYHLGCILWPIDGYRLSQFRSKCRTTSTEFYRFILRCWCQCALAIPRNWIDHSMGYCNPALGLRHLFRKFNAVYRIIYRRLRECGRNTGSKHGSKRECNGSQRRMGVLYGHIFFSNQEEGTRTAIFTLAKRSAARDIDSCLGITQSIAASYNISCGMDLVLSQKGFISAVLQNIAYICANWSHPPGNAMDYGENICRTSNAA